VWWWPDGANPGAWWCASWACPNHGGHRGPVVRGLRTGGYQYHRAALPVQAGEGVQNTRCPVPRSAPLHPRRRYPPRRPLRRGSLRASTTGPASTTSSTTTHPRRRPHDDVLHGPTDGTLPAVVPGRSCPQAPPDHLVSCYRVDRYVVEGVSTADLQMGPAIYPGTPLPGPAGNVAIAGTGPLSARRFLSSTSW